MNHGVNIVINAAQNNRGLSLNAAQAKQVSKVLFEINNAAEEAYEALVITDNMLKAYLNEFGEELMNELLEESEDFIEAEVVELDVETQGVDGFDNEIDELDSSEEE